MKSQLTKRLIFCVTNDLTYDQRMIRICTSLAENGYDVLLVGRKMNDSVSLQSAPYRQKRLSCFSSKGFLFYAEFNLRVFLFLLWKKADLLCAIDLDTILPVLLVSGIKRTRRVYDAHELFCEMKEIATRPGVYRIWKKIERLAVPRFNAGYTVNEPIAAEFRKMYHVQYSVIRNMPVLLPVIEFGKTNTYVLYQGAVNEGRSFETLIPAFRNINAQLIVCGDGNFMKEAKRLVALHKLDDKVIFTGKMPPDKLRSYTAAATVGVTLFDRVGLSNYISLANRFFDYIHAGVPQICVDFPVYRSIVREYEVAVLVEDLSAENLSNQINKLLIDTSLYQRLLNNCLAARENLNWQQESVRLIDFYQHQFSR